MIACTPGGEDGSAAASIRITPETIDLTATEGTSREASIVATATGATNQRIYLRARAEGSGLDSAETSSHETYALVTVRSSPTLSPGTYGGTLTVTACLDEECRRQLGGPSLRIPYSVTVRRLLASPSTLTLTTVGGGTAVEADVAVALPPGVSGFDVSVVLGASWLTIVDRTDAGFRVRAAPWRGGTYQGALRVTAGGEVDLVQVRCDVPPSRLAVAPGAVGLSAASGGSASAPVSVTLPDDASDFEVQARGSGWLALAERSPHGVLVQALSMPPDTYHGSVTFTAGASTAVVPVEYVVGPAEGVEHGILPSESSITLSSEPGQTEAVRYLQVHRPAGISAVQHDIAYSEGSPAGWLLLQEVGPGFLVVASSTLLDPGSYTAEVTLSAGAAAPEVRVPVVFTVGPGLVRPPDRHIAVTSSTTVQHLGGGMRIEAAGASVERWSATSDSAWLVLDEPTGREGEALVYHVDLAHLAAMAPGDERVATVSIEAEPATMPPTGFQVRLSRHLGVIDGIAPYAQPAGRTSRILVRGVGFGDEPLSIEGVGPVTTTRRSVAQVEVQVPALPAARYRLGFQGELHLPRTSVELTLFEPVTLPPTSCHEEGSKRGLTYDPIGRAAFLVNADEQSILRCAYPEDIWVQSRRSIPGLVDIGLSPDGTSLLATTTSGWVLFLDPDTLGDQSAVWTPMNYLAPTPSAGIAVTNDGIAWNVNGTSPLGFVPFVLADRYPMRGVPVHLGEVPFSSTSRDGSRVLFGQPNASPQEPLLYLDVGDSIRPAPIYGHFTTAAQSEDGGRLILDGTDVYDRSFTLLGSTAVEHPYQTRDPFGRGFGAVLAPDGSRAYVLAYTPYADDMARLYVLDTSQPPPAGGPFPVLAARDLPEALGWGDPRYVSPPPALLALSPDELNLFIATAKQLVVLPTSSLFAPPAP